MSPHNDPTYLRLYLLGSQHHNRPGLIERAKERIAEMAEGWKPSGSNWPHTAPGAQGSIIGGGSQSHADDSKADDLLDLAVELVSWLGKGSSNMRARRALVSYLALHHVSDVAYLSERLDEATRIVNQLLKPEKPSEAALERAASLVPLLQAFIDVHEHEFVKVPSEEFEVFFCACGAGYRMAGEEMLAL